ncbi:MAG: hypothetical protein AAFP03_19760, partial [Cyanobacteria bacterium J06598_3]
NDWTLPGMRPLQVSLVLAVTVTALAGVAANPLLQLANSSVARTPLLQRSVLVRNAEIAAKSARGQTLEELSIAKVALSDVPAIAK